MNKREAKQEAWRIAALLLDQDEPDALYIGGTDIGGYFERDSRDYGRMVKAWKEVIAECWRRSGESEK